MSLLTQISIGTILLGFSAVLHVLLVFASLPLLKQIGAWPIARSGLPKVVLLVGAMVTVLLVSHGLQIWLWATVWLGLGAFAELQEALYFSAVTYTTLGYGDIVLGPEIRLFSTFSAVCGLLSFGVSTAFLVGLVSRIMPKDVID
jgi:hypothetical protein